MLRAVTILAVAIFGISIQSANCESTKRAKVYAKYNGLQDLFEDRNARPVVSAFSEKPPIERAVKDTIGVSGHIAGRGRFKVKLGTQKLVKLTSGVADFVLLQGAGFLGGQEVIAFATVKRGSQSNFVMQLSLLTEGDREKDQKHGIEIINVHLQLDDTSNQKPHVEALRLQRVSRAGNANSFCGTAHPLHVGKAHRTATASLSPASFTTVSILLEGDNEYQSKAGALSSSLATMINGVDAWYKRDLGVAFDATVQTTPQTYSSQVTMDGNFEFPLHQEMRQHHPANSRSQYIHYLMTGKNTQADVDGLAGVVPDLGTICRNKADSIGFTIHYDFDNTDNIVTTAHEIGHLFGAEHDDSQNGNTGYIMHSGTTNVSSFVNEFSTFSKNQVGNHLSKNSSCLGNGDGSVPPGGSDPGNGNPGGGDDDDGLGSTDEVEFTARIRRRKAIVKMFLNGRNCKRCSVAVRCASSESGSFDTTLREGLTNRRGKFKVRFEPFNSSPYCKAYGTDYNAESEMVQLGELDDFDEDGGFEDGEDEFPF